MRHFTLNEQYYSLLQERCVDPIKARNAVTRLKDVAKQIRESMSHIHSETETSNYKIRNLEGRNIDAKEVCDRITQEAHDLLVIKLF